MTTTPTPPPVPTLSVNVTNLYTSGRTFFPQAAEKYGNAAVEIHKTGQLDDVSFRRDKVTNDDGTKKPHHSEDPRNQGSEPFTTASDLGLMQPQWTALRNMLQDQILVATRNSLMQAGSTLCKIAEHYAAGDDAARAALEKQRIHLDQTTDPTYMPPSYVPTAPKHDDPHPSENDPYDKGR